MADSWDSWGTGEDDREASGWNTDIVLSTATIGANEGDSSTREKNRNRKNDQKLRPYSPPPLPTNTDGRNFNQRSNPNRHENPNNRNNNEGRNNWVERSRGRNEHSIGSGNNSGNFNSGGNNYSNDSFIRGGGNNQDNFNNRGKNYNNDSFTRGGGNNREGFNYNRSKNDSSTRDGESDRGGTNYNRSMNEASRIGGGNNRGGTNYNRSMNDSSTRGGGNNQGNFNSRGRNHNRDRNYSQSSESSLRHCSYDSNKSPGNNFNKSFDRKRSKSRNRGFDNKTYDNKNSKRRENSRSYGNDVNKNNQNVIHDTDNFDGGLDNTPLQFRKYQNKLDQKAAEPLASNFESDSNEFKKEEFIVQEFDEPPQLFNVESKLTQNDLDDSVSSKISTKSESLASSDPHEVEAKILNMIHEFKTTLHAIDTKPSRHVQMEIKGLKKYIGLIIEKWNPKLKHKESSSDSESSDSSSSDDKKKLKKKKKSRKKKNEYTEKDNKTEDGNGKTSKQGKQNIPGLMDNDVKQFQENTVNFLNQQPMDIGIQQPLRMPGPTPLLHMPMYPPHPSMMIPPPFPMSTPENTYWQMQQKLGPPLLHHNVNPANFQTMQPRGQVIPSFQNSPSKSQSIPTVPNNLIKKEKKSNKEVLSVPNNLITKEKKFNNEVMNIINDIKMSDLIMKKSDIYEIRTALGKLLLVDKGLFNNTDQCKNFEIINYCLVKVFENDTFPTDIKHNILNQVVIFFNKMCDDKTRDSVSKLVDIYGKALKEMQINTTEFNEKDDENYVLLTQISNDNKIFFLTKCDEELFKFKDEAKEALSIQNDTSINKAKIDKEIASNAEDINVSDTEDDSDDEEKEDNSSEDDSTNDEKDNEEPNVTENIKRRGKRQENDTFIGELGLHCKYFLSSEKSMELQVNNLLAIYEHVQSVDMKALKNNLLYFIKDEVRKLYPNCIIHLFGSRASNMALPDSDLDIFIDVTGKGYTNSPTYENQQTYVKKLRKVFFQRPDCFSNVLPLTKTKVPIIKFHHKPSAINCDISFKNGISVENTKLLCYYLSIDPRVKWLITAVKLWAQYNHIYGSDYFTSHALSWLTLFYLMQVKVVPPVMLLKPDVPPRIIDNWNISFKKLGTWTSAATPGSNLELMRGFFSFLQEPLLKKSMLCTFTGDYIPKGTVMNLDTLQTYQNGIFGEYAERVKKNYKATDKNFAKENPSSMPLQLLEDQLCIQDPFEFSKNVSHPVRKKKFAHFLAMSRLTLHHLQHNTEGVTEDLDVPRPNTPAPEKKELPHLHQNLKYSHAAHEDWNE